MRVVGNDKNVERKVTCPACGSMLAYLKKDVNIQHYTDISGCGDTSYTVICPKCNEVISVKAWY